MQLLQIPTHRAQGGGEAFCKWEPTEVRSTHKLGTARAVENLLSVQGVKTEYQGYTTSRRHRDSTIRHRLTLTLIIILYPILCLILLIVKNHFSCR